ncbi:FAD-binding oxidoreductase [Actinomadura meridiana]|uniref:FAD-binding oxidoreductase n=1 Tax=Actinomadura meridiana TaxID=559626 RepID=A0ABP8BW68_9ACTN
MLEANSATEPVQTPVGVWTGSVTHDNQTDPYVISFAPDGTIALRTPVTVGVGTWAAGEPGRFTYELTETFTPVSGHAGEVRAHVDAHLKNNTTHTGTGSAKIYTPDGTLVHTTTAESAGERIADEPAPWHDLVSLGTPMRGRTLHRGDEGFEEAGSGWLLTVEHRPAAIVVAADADDVSAAVRFAAARKLPIAVESTGHGRSVPADGAVFIATEELRELSVDPQARTARIGAGLRWDEVISAAADHGLAPLCGSSEQVGVMGYLTGGGLPLTCRTHGFAADHVRSLDVVTADGSVRTVSPTQEHDLFWAVRGGGSNFGVVTSAEIDLVPLSSVYAGELCYAGEDPAQAALVVRSYLVWAKEQPDEMSSSVTLVRLPDVPEQPDEVRGRSLVQVHIVYTGDETHGARLVEPLRALAPETDTVAATPYRQITELHHDPKHPVRVHFRSALLDEPSDVAVKALVSFIDPASAPEGLFPGIELRHLGGALSRPPARPHAVDARDAAFLLWVRVPLPDGETAPARGLADDVLDRLRPWDTGALLPGFLFDHDSDPERVRRAYSESDHRRLTELKAEYDPHNLFRVNHNIRPVGDGA